MSQRHCNSYFSTRQWRLPILLLTLLLCRSTPVNSQDFSYTVFGKSNGLDCNYVNDIERDQQGYYWLATDRGLYRFDGANFLNIKINSGTLPNIKHLRLSGENLFIIYYGLTKVDVLNINTLITQRLLTGSYTDVIQSDPSTLLAYHTSGYLHQIQNGKTIKKMMLTASADGALTMWNGYVFVLAVARKLHCIDPVAFEKIKEYDLPGHGFVRGELKPQKHKLFINMTGAVVYIDKDLELNFFNGITPKEFDKSHAFTYASKNIQFFIRQDKELITVRSGNSSGIIFPDKHIKELRTIHLVDSANLLIGTNGNLIHYRAENLPIRNFTLDETVAEKSIRVRRNIIPVDKDLTVLAGFPGILGWRQDRVTLVEKLKGMYLSDATLLGNLIYGAGEEKDISWWNFKTNQSGKITPKGTKESDQFITVIADAESGTLLLAGRGGFFRFDPKTETVTKLVELGQWPVTKIKRSTSGDWWLCSEDGLFKFDPTFKLKRRIKASRKQFILKSDTVNDILEVTPNRYWIGHNKGAQLIDLSINKTISEIPDSLLTDTRVASILKDELGRIWFSTFDGLIAHDPTTGTFIKLGQRSNLVNKEFNKRSAATLPDGKLIFGGVAGYDLIDPYEIRFSGAGIGGSISAVEWFSENEQTYKVRLNPTEHDIHFNTDEESIRIHLSANQRLETVSSEFQFRFNKGNWKELDGRQHLDIYKLKPGDYLLEFKGYDRNGMPIALMPVKLHAAVVFYKSSPFIVLVLSGLILSLIIIIIIIRQNQIREHKLKESIAMDLHDEVGTILTRAFMFSRKKGSDVSIEKLQDYLADALFGLRTYIRTMNKERLSIREFLSDLQDMAESALEHTDIEHQFIGESSAEGYYKASMCRDIKLTIFELINNTIKHAQAREITIRISAQKNSFKLDYSDNGKLTSLTQLKKSGSGVSNVEKRCGRYKGSVTWDIAPPGNGIHVTVEFKNQ